MAGYVRQSVASIVASLPVLAASFNNEFNSIETFAATHNHDGTTGGGAKIHLVNSVDTSTKLRLQEGGTNADLSTANTGAFITKGATGLTYARNNLSASAAPTTSDDSTQGYAFGSLWYDSTNSILYTCVSATAGSAAWVVSVNFGTATFPATSNLGMGGFIFTNMGAGSANGHSVRYEQLQGIVDSKVVTSGAVVKRVLSTNEVQLKLRAAQAVPTVASTTCQVGGMQTVSSAGGAFIVYLPPTGSGDTALQDGDMICLLDVGGAIETNNITINGNGNNITFEGATGSSLIWNTPNYGRMWCIWDASASTWLAVGTVAPKAVGSTIYLANNFGAL